MLAKGNHLFCMHAKKKLIAIILTTYNIIANIHSILYIHIYIINSLLWVDRYANFIAAMKICLHINIGVGAGCAVCILCVGGG